MKALLKSLTVMTVCGALLALPNSAKAELCGRLTVRNSSSECVKIFVNGRLIGIVHEGETKYFSVDDHHHATTIKALCEEDNDLVARVHWHGFQDDYFFAVR